MSRSYRKFPLVKCAYDKCGKKFANKKVRNYKGELGNNSNYKKLYNSWNIVDYKSTELKEWIIQYYYRRKSFYEHGIITSFEYNSLEEALIDWKKFYVCK